MKNEYCNTCEHVEISIADGAACASCLQTSTMGSLNARNIYSGPVEHTSVLAVPSWCPLEDAEPEKTAFEKWWEKYQLAYGIQTYHDKQTAYEAFRGGVKSVKVGEPEKEDSPDPQPASSLSWLLCKACDDASDCLEGGKPPESWLKADEDIDDEWEAAIVSVEGTLKNGIWKPIPGSILWAKARVQKAKRDRSMVEEIEEMLLNCAGNCEDGTTTHAVYAHALRIVREIKNQ